MMLAAHNPLDEILDRPWRIGGVQVEWMSSQIAGMILVGVLLAVALPLAARRRRGLVARGAGAAAEMFVLLVRDHIAAPAMGDKARPYVPFLATLLAFVLGLNLLGLIPLVDLTSAAGLADTPVGGTPTGSIYVCGALALMTLGMLLAGAYWLSLKALWRRRSAGGHEDRHAHRPRAGLNVLLGLSNALLSRRWPLPVAAVAAVPVWLNSFVPPIPGLAGLVLWPMLLALELIGYISKCIALCIRLFANMVNGHLLLAVLLVFVVTATDWAVAYVSIPTAAASVLSLLLDTLVAVIQAYIFTFLTALYIGLAAYPKH